MNLYDIPDWAKIYNVIVGVAITLPSIMLLIISTLGYLLTFRDKEWRKICYDVAYRGIAIAIVLQTMRLWGQEVIRIFQELTRVFVMVVQ